MRCLSLNNQSDGFRIEQCSVVGKKWQHTQIVDTMHVSRVEYIRLFVCVYVYCKSDDLINDQEVFPRSLMKVLSLRRAPCLLLPFLSTISLHIDSPVGWTFGQW